MDYVIDTCSLNLLEHYPPDIFTGLWQSIDELVANGQLTSVHEVYLEMNQWTACPVFVDQWVKANRSIFAVAGHDEQVFVGTIIGIRQFNSLIPQINQAVGTPFADPLLIARARITGSAVVTEERPKPNSLKIPTICAHFGIPCIRFEDMLRAEGMRF